MSFEVVTKQTGEEITSKMWIKGNNMKMETSTPGIVTL
jgi:hypothetical protein